ncbi:family 2 glycosyl transferase [Clostridium magnum]|uniref:Family 2 glycosyl transferase n=1 Tax=Clostridium magnum DSM 2767 TaxID=1121326 RepID=A0A162T1X0_9CLOT|nr:family 2 glycosyl transferase [Clostridium magnum]KZL92147.1 hypothetical protein CLMAG_19560 [Clostridium magnum DSM 2767]SHH20450.1 hypothetical protein SAMN02745944_00271 [Clostridium magnum DSM 2767]
MKKYLAFVVIAIVSVFLSYKYVYIIRNKMSIYKDNVSYMTKVDDKFFYVYKYGKWKKEFIKGVNIGAAKPGAFPGELAVTKEEYKRWFKQIADMNANSIRVYTTLKPEFYDALYEYNKEAIKPIYIFQGVWVNEEDISNLMDAQNSKIKDAFKEDTKNLVDVIHGNANLPAKKGYASGVYTKDVSTYVMGWILGIEWDPHFVENTNLSHPKENSFEGKYLYTENASPFEEFLCEVGDYAIQYETDKYNMQRPVSFTNWVTTDTLSHPNEPLKNEDMASVNTEHIKKKESFRPGLFASYHVYPYYPDFMNYQQEYSSFKDKDGKVNTYRAYLKDLRKEHSVPVLVAEFGIPASRGKAHENIHMGFNQGNVDEKKQGEMDAFMLNNIYEEGYAGGLVFTWQDEWFKRTWNTMDLDIPDKRAYWSNAQTNEQEFGLLAFETGKDKSICYVDGDTKDWNKDNPIVQNNNFKLYTKSDEKYVYFMADIPGFNFDKDSLLVPIDIAPEQGNSAYKEYGVSFKRPVDFVIALDNKNGSRVLVDSYYDSFYYIYAKQLKMIESNPSYETKDSGNFNPIYLCLNKELYLPQDNKTIPFSKYETGKLVQGDGNPEHKEYNSLVDFSVKDDKVEIRIPWQLLNVMDPSTKMIMDDLYEKGIKSVKIPGFYTGGILIKDNSTVDNSEMKLFSWKEWELPEYHERLKPSYYILKKAFEEIGEN